MTPEQPGASEPNWRRMVDLRVAVRASSPHADHLGDLLWIGGTHTLDPSRDLRLWEAPDGGLAAYALLLPPAELVYDVHPGARARTPGLEAEVVAWGVARAEAQTAARAITAQAPEDDASRLALLRRLGFDPQERYVTHLVYPLTAPVPAAVHPAGFVVRPLAGEHEVPAYVAAHRDAWGPESRVTAERHLRLMRAPGYSRDLNLVAVGPDGTFAATLIGWLDQANRAGEIEPLGVRPAYRRRGLGRALVLDALHRFRDRGATTAEVWGLGETNPPATALYTSLGFRETGRVFTLAKPLALVEHPSDAS